MNELIILKDVLGVKWTKSLMPVCVEHNFELDGVEFDSHRGVWTANEWGMENMTSHLECLEGPHIIELPMTLGDIREYITKKLLAKQYVDARLVDLDGLLVPVSKKEKISIGETDYFITSQVKSGKRGDQVVIYAGKKGSADKAQIFVDPQHRKMSFDQNNLNPTDVFAKLEATFRDGTKHIIETRKD